MNLFIYLKLLHALIFGKVKIRSNYKHIDFLIDENILIPIYDGVTEIEGTPFPKHSDYYELTSEGKFKCFLFSNQLTTWIISLTALIFSIIAIVINLSK